MEFFFKQNKAGTAWMLYILRPDGMLAWIATRSTLNELRELVR